MFLIDCGHWKSLAWPCDFQWNLKKVGLCERLLARYCLLLLMYLKKQGRYNLYFLMLQSLKNRRQHMRNQISGCRLIGRVCTAEEHHLNSTDMQKQDGWRHQSSLCIRFLQTCALKLALSDVLCEIEAYSAASHDQTFFYFPNKRPVIVKSTVCLNLTQNITKHQL